MASRIFTPYHAVGLYTGAIPFAMHSWNNQHLIATAVNDAFHIYSLDKLRLVFVGYAPNDNTTENATSNYIQCLLFYQGVLYVSQGGVIRAWQRGKVIGTYTYRNSPSIHYMLGCGVNMLTADENGSVRIWKRYGGNFGDEHLEIPFELNSFRITSLLHPDTYINKVVFGSYQGSLQLWNIKRGCLIHEFAGWGSPVLSLSQSPTLDVIAAGLQSGDVYLHDLKFDKPVMHFIQDAPVRAITFRLDGVATLCTGSPEGEIAVWDLDKERLKGVVRDGHSKAINGLQFLPNQEVMISTGNDNSIKVWAFDESDGMARLLKHRSGHVNSPSKVRFFSPGGLAVLSASRDGSFRLFSLVKSSSHELSQGHIINRSHKKGIALEQLRLPTIIDFSVELTRANDWDSIVSVHLDTPWVQTWDLFKHKIGKHRLKAPYKEDTLANIRVPLCVASSPCGNFAVVGYTSGHIELFNIQSGIHRGTFGATEPGSLAHKGQVRSIAVNSSCSLVYSAGSDGTIRFWNFQSQSLIYKLSLRMAVSKICLHRSSSLLAVALDDFTIHIVDTDTAKVVRTLTPPSQLIDLTFSPDARWLVSSHSDATIRTWNLPTGHLIDYFRVESLVTSLAMSPSGETLVTTHADSPGVFMWSNKTLYGRVSLRAIDENSFSVKEACLPRSTGEEDRDGGVSMNLFYEDLTGSNGEDEINYEDYSTPEILDPNLLTLSLLPKSHWHSLAKLDIIRERNKPLEPILPQNSAPFFLSTKPNPASFSFVTPTQDFYNASTEENSRIKIRHMQDDSALIKVLNDCHISHNFEKLTAMLKELGPSAIEVEIRLLGPEDGGSVEALEYFIDYLCWGIESKSDFELYQALIELFTRLYTSQLTSPEYSDIYCAKLELLKNAQIQSWEDVASKMRSCLCLIDFFKNTTI